MIEKSTQATERSIAYVGNRNCEPGGNSQPPACTAFLPCGDGAHVYNSIGLGDR
jgi:hypothetical protein